MNTTSYPIRPIKTEKLTLSQNGTPVSTRSQPCRMVVISGKVYVAGKRDSDVSTDCFCLSEGDRFEFFGDVKLCSDKDGADVRLLYYDIV